MRKSGGRRSASVIACDDGRVEKLGSGYTIVACILWSGAPLDVALSKVRVDGLEASSTIAYLAKTLALKAGGGVEMLLVDSLTIAGFNIVSPPTIVKLAGLPLIAVYKYKPSSYRLEEALRKHFKDWRLRMNVLKLLDSTVKVETRKGELYMVAWGLSVEEALKIVESLQIHSRIPEPLRIADMTASEAARMVKARGE